MGILDVVFAILLAWGLYKGFKNGLLIELASLIAFIVGLFGAIHFSYIAGDYLSENMEWNQDYINILAFIITFITLVLAVHIIGKLLTKIADFALVGWLNKIAGGIFGVLKVAVVLGAFLIFFDRANTSMGIIEEEHLQNSILYGPIKDIGIFVFERIFPEKV
ncbi:MAG: CvpA family protein [Flavobacteriaceae bacterium]